MKIKSYLLLLGIIFLAILSFSLISENGESRVAVWDGEGADNLASNPLNWNLNTSLVVNDVIVFNSTSTKNCIWDVSISLGNFSINVGYTGTITQSSDMHISGYSQADGSFVPINTKRIYGLGEWKRTGGTWNPFLGNVYFIDNATNPTGGFSFYTLTISEGKTFTSQDIHNIRNKLYIYGTLINTGTIQLDWQSMGSSCIVGNGDIQNSGLIKFKINSMNYQINYSKPLGNVQITNYGSSDNKITALSDLNIGTLTYSVEATYTCTLDLNGHSLTATTITVGTRGILKCGSGSIYTNSLTSTLGTIIPETSTFIIEENGNINIGTTNYLYNLNVKNIINFASDCNITNNLIFRENLINRDYGLYFDTVRQYTVTSNSNGLIIKDAIIINSTEISIFLKPLIILSYINIDDNTIAINDFYHAEYISDIPVNWTFNSTANWITFENGNISGIANITDTFYYTITATSLNGEVTTYTGYIYVASVYDLQMNTLILIIWIVLMIVFLLISLKYTEWGILGGIIWLLAGLLEFMALNTSLGLIIISIGMFIMLYGVYELFKR